MAVSDPIDARLLTALAESGKVAVHELAARVGMDPREVAYRLVALSGSGLPLLVGVECDRKGIRAALTAPAPSGPMGPPSGAHPVQGTPSGPHPGAHGPAHGVPSGQYPVQGTPSAAYPVQGTPSAGYPVQGTPSAAYPVQSGVYRPPPQPAGPMGTHRPAPAPSSPQRPAGPLPEPQSGAQPQSDAAFSTWGVPQSASWARGDKPAGGATATATTHRTGKIGDALRTEGLEGEQLTVQLLEVQDPADYLFGAGGYRLDSDERAVVVHTEITNNGGVPFVSLPDNYLELITADGRAVAKAPVSLSSRPPHRIGVQPGETCGGHTVYVLPEQTRVVSVRWSPRPEPDERTLTWTIDI